MIVGFNVTLDIGIKPKKGEKLRKFDFHWVGTFMSYPTRDAMMRALRQEGIDRMNSGDTGGEQKGRQFLTAAGVLQQLPDWPKDTVGRLGNDFLTLRVLDIPIHGDEPRALPATMVPQQGSTTPPEETPAGEGTEPAADAGGLPASDGPDEPAVPSVQPAGATEPSQS